jgi:hypothetical protein
MGIQWMVRWWVLVHCGLHLLGPLWFSQFQNVLKNLFSTWIITIVVICLRICKKLPQSSPVLISGNWIASWLVLGESYHHCSGIGSNL